jgi:hypothetical protein
MALSTNHQKKAICTHNRADGFAYALTPSLILSGWRLLHLERTDIQRRKSVCSNAGYALPDDERVDVVSAFVSFN